MAKKCKTYSECDAANTAVRALLAGISKKLGEITPSDWDEIQSFFGDRCAYCKIGPPEEKDHLIPMNQTHCGLHVPANIVPACSECNSGKEGKKAQEWKTFLKKRGWADREVKIQEHIQNKRWKSSRTSIDQEDAKKLYQCVQSHVKSACKKWLESN